MCTNISNLGQRFRTRSCLKIFSQLNMFLKGYPLEAKAAPKN